MNIRVTKRRPTPRTPGPASPGLSYLVGAMSPGEGLATTEREGTSWRASMYTEDIEHKGVE